MNLTIAGIGAALLVIFAVLHFLRIFPTIRAACAFAGVCLVAGAAAGAAGFDFVIVVVSWVESLLSDLTQWLIGVRIGALVLAIPLVIVFIHDMHPKNSASKRTGWAGIALALVMIAGVAQIPVLSRIPGDLRTGVTNARTSIQSGQGH
jgi:hypothetical protein